ncbi:MAG: hemolysin III family protein [Fidelibacterota bacterium]
MRPSRLKEFYHSLKDPMSGLTHFIGLLLAMVALVVLLIQAIQLQSVWHIVSYAIFGAGLILLYSASTLYHWIPVTGKAERILRKVDHIMIFVLIAASYTPVCLIPLRGPWGWSIFGVVWSIAFAGIALKILYIHAPDWLAATIYLGMGWLALVAIYPLIMTLQPKALFWLFAGGIFYSVGALIFALEKPRMWPSIFGSHDLFHILVMAGSASHFWFIHHYISQIA